MSTLGKLWNVYRAYSPEEARRLREERKNRPARFGAFAATYRPPGAGVRRPRTDADAQRMYNHIRTVAFWLDSAPVLADLGLPFRAGIDDIISLVPIYGDIASGILQLYQVWLCFIFGVPRNTLGLMLLNVLLDVVVGIVPLIGDVLDNLFKSNLRNLALLEDWLLARGSEGYRILLMPETTEFLPLPSARGDASAGGSGEGWGAWFGFGAGKRERRAQRNEEREGEWREGRVRRTRRMEWGEEGRWGGATPGAGAGVGATGATATATETEFGRTRTRARTTRASQRASGVPLSEPLD